jgi:ligand-binding SRPBCC domain-containing protein
MSYKIEHTVNLAIPVEQAFAWYTNLDNVRRMTPPELHLRILRAETPLKSGSRVLFSIRPKFVPFEINWLLQVEDFQLNHRFSERLLNGPFDYWVHSHDFISQPDGGCQIVDKIEWDRPAFLLRAVASDSYINEKLMETFHYRESILRTALQQTPPAVAGKG